MRSAVQAHFLAQVGVLCDTNLSMHRQTLQLLCAIEAAVLIDCSEQCPLPTSCCTIRPPIFSGVELPCSLPFILLLLTRQNANSWAHPSTCRHDQSSAQAVFTSTARNAHHRRRRRLHSQGHTERRFVNPTAHHFFSMPGLPLTPLEMQWPPSGVHEVQNQRLRLCV